MKDTSLNILLLDGASSQVLPLMRSFYKSGHHVSIISPSRIGTGSFSRYAHKKIVWPGFYTNEEETYVKLIDYLEKHRTDLLLGLSDKSAKLLSENSKELKSLTHIIVPEYSVFRIASDKMETMKFCMEQNIFCPLTFVEKDIEEVEKAIKFPVIIKPRVGVGSVGVFKYTDSDRLKKDYAGLVKEYGDLIVQEYIPNEEQYTVEAFCDRKSKVKACVVISKSRYYPVSGGTSSCNVTVDKPEIESAVVRFLEQLKWVGSANLDLIFDKRDRTPKIIEINPRVGAMVRVAFEAGVDLADLHLEFLSDSAGKDVWPYKKGVILRNMLLEVPWFISSFGKQIVNSAPSFFGFFGRNVYYENFRIDDPFTGLGYFLGNVRKYINPVVFRKKFFKKKST